MSAVTRTNLVRAPGHLKFGASTYIYSTTPIEVNIVTKRSDYAVEGFGRVRRVQTDRYLEITCRPAEFEGYGALMSPYATMETGASIFGASADVPLVFYGRDGKSRTFHASAPTAFGLSGKMGEPLLNQLTFTAIIKNGGVPGAANAYYTEATATYPGDTNFSRVACITPALVGSWGASPFDVMHFTEGLDIAFALDLQPDMVDGIGTVDMKFQDCIINARGIPVGFSLTELYTAADFDTALGAQANYNDLILSGTGFHFTAYGAQLEDPNTGFSSTRLIPGQALWTTNRNVIDGERMPIFRLDTASEA